MATLGHKRERLEARVTADQKALLQRAAALEGRSVSDFMVSSIQTAALETIRRHDILSLTATDSARFIEALLNPPEPNDALRKAVARHRALLGD